MSFQYSSHLQSLGWHPSVVFVARHSGLVLDATNGEHCEQQPRNNGPSQTFFLVDAGGGQYNIVNKATGKYLDVHGGSADDGRQIILWQATGGANQQWSLTPSSDGHFVIKAKHSGKSLDVEGAGKHAGAKIFQYSTHGGENQQWRMERIDSDVVKIRIRRQNLVLDIENTNNGAKVFAKPESGAVTQKFVMQHVGEGYYRLTTATAGRALDVNGSGTENGKDVIVWDHHGGANQQWRLEPRGNGWFSLHPRHAESVKRVLDLNGGNVNAQLAIWDFHGGENQQFRFEFA